MLCITKFFVYFALSKIEQKTTNTQHKSISVHILVVKSTLIPPLEKGQGGFRGN